MRHTELGRDDHAVAHVGKGAAHHVLVMGDRTVGALAHVTLGGVKEAVPHLARLANHPDGLVVGQGLTAGVGDSHATHTDRRHLNAA